MDGGEKHHLPEIIGKPNPFVIELIQKEHGIEDRCNIFNCLNIVI
jgi:hypothetical protein